MIQITLTITLKQLEAITQLLKDTQLDSHTSPTATKQSKQDEVLEEEEYEAVELSIDSTKPTMPKFGRSTSQVNEYTQKENTRLTKKAEELQLKKDKATKLLEEEEALKEEIELIKSVEKAVKVLEGFPHAS